MRVLQVNNIFPPKPHFSDGITRVVHNISKELARRGHEVFVYTSNALDLYTRRKTAESVYRTPNNVHVQYSNYLWKYGPFFLTPSIIPLLRRTLNKFDVVHIHDAKSFQGLAAYLVAVRKKVPYVFQPHGSISSPLPLSLTRRIARLLLDTTISKRLAKNSSHIIAVNKYEAEQCSKQLKIPKERITIVPNGIDMAKYDNLPPKGAFKRKFSIPDKKKVILFLGRIHEIKGIDILVKAFSNLLKELDDVRLVVAGPDDGYLGKLEALVKTLDLEDEILITGPLFGKDKLEAYVDAQVYVLPSRYETFPMGLLEVFACGKPVVCSKVSGLKELVANGVNGLFFEPGDVNGLASSISYLLNNRIKAEEIGLRGREVLERKFTINTVVNRLENLYSRVIGAN